MNMMKIAAAAAAAAAAAGTPTDQANSIIEEEEEDAVVFEVAEDLILEILSHLPPISLLRFKSVSKTWYSLISNPDFLRRNTANQQFDHKRITTTSSDLLLKHVYFYNAEDSRILTLLPPPPPSDNDDQPAFYSCFHKKISPLLLKNICSPEHGGRVMVIDSCNGLILFRNGNMYSIAFRRKYALYVCNPITHDYIKLPTFKQQEREHGFKMCEYSSPNIVFDPSISLTYKVVTWLTCTTKKKEQSKHYRLYVYSSKTRSWKLSISTTNHALPVDPDQFHFTWRGVLCNGVLYWPPSCPSFGTNVSLCYDVDKDVISTLKFPKRPPTYRYRILLYFGECGGRLRLIEKYFRRQQLNTYGFPSIFDVMELDNNDDSWTVKYRVNVVDDQEGYYANLIGNHRCSISVYRVHILDLYKTKTKKAAGEDGIDQGEEEEELLLRIGNICIIPFNLSSNKFGKELRNGEKKSAGERFFDLIVAYQTLRYNTITLFPPSLSS